MAFMKRKRGVAFSGAHSFCVNWLDFFDFKARVTLPAFSLVTRILIAITLHIMRGHFFSEQHIHENSFKTLLFDDDEETDPTPK